jgi:hypothetical protein
MRPYFIEQRLKYEIPTIAKLQHGHMGRTQTSN